ncbi:MAG: AI-2E family transporter [Rickettsiales bacterium]|jgi:predicted PurR-regulated permease PerM|nr:AI-2E family transporter [Rickettsiales bacterium]
MNGIIIFLALLFILFIGRTIFIPIVVATFVWYLLNAIAAYYRKILPFRKIEKYTPKFSRHIFDALSFLLSFGTFGGLVYLFITQIRPAFAGLIARLPEIQAHLGMLSEFVSKQFGITINADFLPDTSHILSSVGASATQFSAGLGLVLIYIFFMYIEQSTFSKKFAALFPKARESNKMRYILQSIDDNMKKYMFVKTATSALTAIISYFWMHYLGLEFAGVWAFIIFIMNYIPTFGTIIATALPILYSLITIGTANEIILIAAGLIALQILIGNILEPRLTGRTLNLSTLAILINLVFWGMLWGPVGMFFSVPFLVAIFVITAQFDRTRWIAILLSTDGAIPEKEEG